MTFGALVGMVCRSSLPAAASHVLIGLLSLLEDDASGTTTLAQISERTRRSLDAVRAAVAELERMGVVVRSGTPGGRWSFRVDEAALRALTPGKMPGGGKNTPGENATSSPGKNTPSPLPEMPGDPWQKQEGSTRNMIPRAGARNSPSSVLETPSPAGAREGGQGGQEDTTPPKPMQPTTTAAPVEAHTTTPAAPPRLAVVPAQPAADGLVIADLEAVVLACMRHGGVRGQRHGALMLAPLESQQLVGLVDRYGADAVRTVLTERCAGADRPLAMARKILAETPEKTPDDEIDVHPVYGAAPPGHVWVGGATISRQYADDERRALERRRNPPPRSAAATAELDRVLALLSEGAA